MGIAVISDNVTLKISAAVSATATGTSGTVYTCPANTYALVQVTINDQLDDQSYAYTLSVDSKRIVGNAGLGVGVTATHLGVIIGPSQALTYTSTTTCIVNVTGVALINSP
jgi:hypothetical protein